MTFKPVGIDEDSLFPPRVETRLNATIDEETSPRIFVAPLTRPKRNPVTSIIEPFAAGHGWTIFSGTAASLSDDTTDFALGSQSVVVTTKTDTTAGSIQKSGYSTDLTGKQLVLWVKVAGVVNLNQLLVYAGDSTLANSWSWTIGSIDIAQQAFREGEWTPITLSFADAAAAGSPVRSAVTLFRLRTGSVSGTSITVHYGGIGTVDEPTAFPNGVISITCDDSYATQYNVLRPLLDKYGWGATAYTIVDMLGDPGSMTVDQLRSLERSNGWEVAGHAFTLAAHTAGYAAPTPLADIESDVRQLREWLLVNGFRGADHLAYPGGRYDTESEPVMAKYFATGRTVTNRLIETVRPSNAMRLRTMSFVNTTTLGTAQAMVDKVKSGKAWGIFTFHDLVTTPTLGTQWSIANATALLAYIAAAGVPVLLVSEVVARA